MTPASPTPPTDLLRSIDPAHPASVLSATEAEARDRLLLQLQTSPADLSPAVVSPAFLRRPRLTRRNALVTLGAVAATACAAALVFAALPNTHASSTSYALPAHGSLASWTATPQFADPTPADIDLCATQLAFVRDPERPISVVTTEQRGDFTSLVVQQGDAEGYCVLSEGSIVNWENFTDLQAQPLSDPNAANIGVMQGAEWMIVVTGRAGANVTGVTVNNPDGGAPVTAVMANGVWSAWWPLSPQSRATTPFGMAWFDEVSIDYTLADGSTRNTKEMSDDPVNDAPAQFGTPPALGTLAGWAGASTAVIPAAADVDACGAAVNGWSSGTASVLVADTRGGFETLLIARGGDRGFCVLRDGSVQWSQEHGAAEGSSSEGVGAADILEGFDVDNLTSNTRAVAYSGVAGTGVVSVTVHLGNSADVQATVQNGVWLAWWPEVEPVALREGAASTAPATDGPEIAPAPEAMPTISWVTDDGVQHDQSK